MKRMLCTILALALCLALAAPATAEKINNDEYVELEWYCRLDPVKPGVDDVMDVFNQYLMDQGLNCKVNAHFFPAADYTQKMSTMVSAGQELDFLHLGGVFPFVQNAQDGVLAPIEELLPVYAADTFAMLPQGLWDAVTVNGHIYGILPLATYVAPALAGILIVPVAIEFGIKTGYVLYAAIGLLSLFVVPDKEMSLIFVFFLGFYPLLKASIERMRSRAAQWAVKLAVFNACIVGMYGIILFLFPIGAVVEEFESMGIPFTGLLLLMGNVTFVIYDVAVARIIGLYCARFRARLMKMH